MIRKGAGLVTIILIILIGLFLILHPGGEHNALDNNSEQNKISLNN